MKDLTLNKACLAIFPLHDHLSLTLLQQKWLRLFALPHRQPEAQIKVRWRVFAQNPMRERVIDCLCVYLDSPKSRALNRACVSQFASW
jgi:hypothetical protein